MKRLTEYTIPETGFSVVSEEKYKRILMEEKPSVEKVYNRLKKIEDILGDEYDLDRLRELVEAYQDSRCTITPQFVYRVGETRGVVKIPYKTWMGRFLETKFFTTREAAEAAMKAREQDGNNK